MKLIKCLMMLACASLFAAGCALTPFEGETGNANDRFTFSGGTPYAGSNVLVECKVAGSSSYTLINMWEAPTVLDPNTAPYGDFYAIQEYFTVPSDCWFGDNHAEVRVRNFVNGSLYSIAYTFDQAGHTCLNAAPTPATTQTYQNCAQNSTGLITVCRSGTSWNGSSCN